MFNFLQSTIPQTFLIFKHFFKLTSANISFNHLLKMYVDSLYLHLYSCPANRFICIIFLREGNENPLQYSCLENPMDGGAWQATVHGVVKSQTRLSDFTFMHWRRKWQPTPVFLPGESQGWGSLVGCHLWGRIESDTIEGTQQQQQQQQTLHLPTPLPASFT